MANMDLKAGSKQRDKKKSNSKTRDKKSAFAGDLKKSLSRRLDGDLYNEDRLGSIFGGISNLRIKPNRQQNNQKLEIQSANQSTVQEKQPSDKNPAGETKPADVSLDQHPTNFDAPATISVVADESAGKPASVSDLRHVANFDAPTTNSAISGESAGKPESVSDLLFRAGIMPAWFWAGFLAENQMISGFDGKYEGPLEPANNVMFERYAAKHAARSETSARQSIFARSSKYVRELPRARPIEDDDEEEQFYGEEADGDPDGLLKSLDPLRTDVSRLLMRRLLLARWHREWADSVPESLRLYNRPFDVKVDEFGLPGIVAGIQRPGAAVVPYVKIDDQIDVQAFFEKNLILDKKIRDPQRPWDVGEFVDYIDALPFQVSEFICTIQVGAWRQFGFYEGGQTDSLIGVAIKPTESLLPFWQGSMQATAATSSLERRALPATEILELYSRQELYWLALGILYLLPSLDLGGWDQGVSKAGPSVDEELPPEFIEDPDQAPAPRSRRRKASFIDQLAAPRGAVETCAAIESIERQSQTFEAALQAAFSQNEPAGSDTRRQETRWKATDLREAWREPGWRDKSNSLDPMPLDKSMWAARMAFIGLCAKLRLISRRYYFERDLETSSARLEFRQTQHLAWQALQSVLKPLRDLYSALAIRHLLSFDNQQIDSSSKTQRPLFEIGDNIEEVRFLTDWLHLLFVRKAQEEEAEQAQLLGDYMPPVDCLELILNRLRVGLLPEMRDSAMRRILKARGLSERVEFEVAKKSEYWSLPEIAPLYAQGLYTFGVQLSDEDAKLTGTAEVGAQIAAEKARTGLLLRRLFFAAFESDSKDRCL